jgi:hypothetical protein
MGAEEVVVKVVWAEEKREEKKLEEEVEEEELEEEVEEGGEADELNAGT